MSRRVSLCVAAVLAMPLSTLFSVAGRAQCTTADPNRCSVAECNTRQTAVDDRGGACKATRSCANIAPTRRNEAKLNQYLGLNQQCQTDRLYVGQCYAVTDRGHAIQNQNVQNAINTCQNLINQIPQ